MAASTCSRLFLQLLTPRPDRFHHLSPLPPRDAPPADFAAIAVAPATQSKERQLPLNPDSNHTSLPSALAITPNGAEGDCRPAAVLHVEQDRRANNLAGLDAATEAPGIYEDAFADQIAEVTNAPSATSAFDVDEHGHAVLEDVLTRDGVVPVIRDGIDPIPLGVSFRVIPTTLDDLEAVADLGILALALNKNRVRGDNPRALALLAKVKDLNAAGMAAYAWGTSPLVPPPPPKPKIRPKPRRAGPRVVFPNLFAEINDPFAAQTDERAAPATEPSKAEQVPSARGDDAAAIRNNGANNA